MLQIPLEYVCEILVIVSPDTTVYWTVGPIEQVAVAAAEVEVGDAVTGIAVTRPARAKRAMIEACILKLV